MSRIPRIGRRVALAALLLAATVSSPQRARAAVTSDPQPILVSRQLAEAARLSAGEIVTLSADPKGAGGRTFRVVGIYEPTPDPMRLTARRLEARLHLPDLLSIVADPSDPLSADSVSSINVALRDPGDADRFLRDLAARMPGLYAGKTHDSRNGSGPFVAIERFHLAISLVTVLGSTAFLLALMVIRADERRETVGILRLLGFSRRRVLSEVLLEGLFIAVSGAVFGVLFAVATEGAVNRLFQWRYDTALVFVRVTPAIAARCVAVAAPLGVLAGVLASWTVLRSDIVALLRR